MHVYRLIRCQQKQLQQESLFLQSDRLTFNDDVTVPAGSQPGHSLEEKQH